MRELYLFVSLNLVAHHWGQLQSHFGEFPQLSWRSIAGGPPLRAALLQVPSVRGYGQGPKTAPDAWRSVEVLAATVPSASPSPS